MQNGNKTEQTTNNGPAIEERWKETWNLIGSSAPSKQLQLLVNRYSETHRAYHNLQHITACLSLGASVRPQLAEPGEVELALWYHDAIYEPRAADNEERSAELALTELSFLGANTLASISALILSTKHAAAPIGNDAQFLVDIDLAILGAPAGRFNAYETAIRREYKWVPRPLFRRKRREILQAFLDRPRIYSTAHFFSLLESNARANLSTSIAQLS